MISLNETVLVYFIKCNSIYLLKVMRLLILSGWLFTFNSIFLLHDEKEKTTPSFPPSCFWTVIGSGRSCDLQRDCFITPNLLSSTLCSVYLLIGADEKICFLLCQLIHFQLCWASRSFQKQNNFQPTIQAAGLIGPRAAKKRLYSDNYAHKFYGFARSGD